MSNEERTQKLVETLHILFEAKMSTVEETSTLVNISHNELCAAFVYWIDQSKWIFGEVLSLHSFHGFKEEGIDVAVDFIREPQIRFGIQIKSVGDIKATEGSFATQIHAQINRSHKHSLTKVLVAFAEDMTDQSQKAKVEGIISEIHQQADNYVIPIRPEKVVST